MKKGYEEIQGHVYRVYVPYLTKDKVQILPEKRQKVIQQIRKRFHEVNGGSTTYNQAEGGFTSTTGEITEPILVIESRGKNPFSLEDCKAMAKYLDQAALLLEVIYNSKAFLIPQDDTPVKKVDIDIIYETVYDENGVEIGEMPVRIPDIDEAEPVEASEKSLEEIVEELYQDYDR